MKSNVVQIYGCADNTLNQQIYNKTYIGIDFGTSTTVVSAMCTDAQGHWYPQALQLAQPDGLGGIAEQEIVNSVLAWVKTKGTNQGQMLFGRTAYQFKPKLIHGKSYFSSFKMDLGIDLGPTYPDTELSKKSNTEYVIEYSKDAVYIFFKFLIKSIYEAIEKRKLPQNLEFAISVPASFQANQRNDLLDSVRKAGISLSESCLIDEPNAAFLSYFYEIVRNNDSVTKNILESQSANILVYDFGAGTCDVSILNVSITNNSLHSKNLAISKFTALGGDNIDVAIASMLFDKIQIEKK